jgi:hypothetical protein
VTKLGNLGDLNDQELTYKNMELYVVAACTSQEDSECGPFI